ncbi:E3 ubiquitin-protein ligase parkin [Nymphon striatum]|nr:E3 ubiquitin-protein ligase parkin [Nymphon striatum]
MSSALLKELSRSIERLLQSLFEIIVNIFLKNDNKTKEIENADVMKVNVKIGKNCSYLIDIKKQDDIAKLKDLVLKKAYNGEILDLKIIFAGKELRDTVKIQEYDIGQYSVIHAVTTKSSKSLASETSCDSSKPISHILLQNEIGKDLVAIRKHICFYVYCSSCKDLCPGKLRVNCASCKQGTLTVDKDPNCWNDVLEPKKITGICQTADCSGNVAEFYFKCASSDHDVHIIEDNRTVALNLIRSNLYDVCCMICTEVCPIILVFQCPSTHAICIECFNQYCSVRINERQFVQDAILGYTLPCPGSIKAYLSAAIMYEKYQRFGAEECLLQAGGVLCPQPNCGAGILPDEICKKVTCVQEGSEGCGFVFCRICMQGYHIGECVDQPLAEDSQNENRYLLNNEKIDQSRWNEASLFTIKVTTKPCPSCRTPTERNGIHFIL